MEWLNLSSLTYWFQKIVNYLRRAKPVFEFEHKLQEGVLENSYCHCRRDNIAGTYGWFLRLGINNCGSMPIQNTNVRVEKIERVFPEERVEMGGTPFFLHWANENTDNLRTIYQDTPVFVDVVHTLAGQNQMYIFAKPKHAGAGIRNNLPPGEYILTLKLLGENIHPVEQKVFVKFQNWDNPYMELFNR